MSDDQAHDSLASYVLLIRRAKPAAVVEAVAKVGVRLQDGFALVEPGRVRIARRPQD